MTYNFQVLSSGSTLDVAGSGPTNLLNGVLTNGVGGSASASASALSSSHSASHGHGGDGVVGGLLGGVLGVLGRSKSDVDVVQTHASGAEEQMGMERINHLQQRQPKVIISGVGI